MTRLPAGTVVGGTLLLAGNTLHARDVDGRYCTHRALARQLDEWFSQFDRVVIAAVLDDGPVPTGFAPYARRDIDFVPLAKAGGVGLRAKLDALGAAWSWIRCLVPLLRSADVVHLRAPCNITIPAIPLARVLSPRRYAIYAGAWDPPPGGSRSYSLQRWMLRHFGGVVHVYAPASPDLAPNLRPNFSPSFTDERLDELGVAAERRLAALSADPPADRPLRVSCVGRFSANKNQAAVVEAVARLAGDGIPAELRFAGEGGTEDEVRALADRLGVSDRVHFLGRLDEAELVDLWTWADVNAAPTLVEGFGRVILEALSLGCPNICGPGAVQADLVGWGSRGVQVSPPTAAAIAAALAGFRSQDLDAWTAQAASALAFARTRTVEAFGADVRDLLAELGQEGRSRADGASR